MIADNRTFIDRFKGTFSKTDAVQSRVKMLEKVIVQVDEVDNSSLKLKFPTVRSGQYPVIVKDLTKAYGEHVVLKMQILLLKEARKLPL
jgi:ATP-binding cassette subfamily F protein 3